MYGTIKLFNKRKINRLALVYEKRLSPKKWLESV